MGRHDVIVQPDSEAVRKVDAEQRERRRAALSETIIGKRCLGACQVLFDYSNGVEGIKAAIVQDAATTVIREVQAELEQQSSPLEIEIAYELAYARRYALHALMDQMTIAQAKRVELEITGGSPLTICTGAELPRRVVAASESSDAFELREIYNSRRAPFLGKLITIQIERLENVVLDLLGSPKVLREVQIPMSGCFRIIPDSMRTSARPWAYWCPDCRAQRTRMEDRLKDRFRRSIAGLFRQSIAGL